MAMLRGLTISSLLVIFLAASVGVQAEVSVRTDRQGEYLMTQVLHSGPHLAEKNVWSPRGRGSRTGQVLNPHGDANGDLWPSVAEAPSTPHYPWVVWSRFNGLEYDLAWSRWTERGWSDIASLGRPAAAGDDLDPDLMVNSEGRPFTVWWRDEEGGGRVYVSVFLANRWMPAYLISDPQVDSRYPSLLSIEPDGSLSVEYATPEGTVSGIVVFELPDTIVDDINPQVVVKAETFEVSTRKY
jgi:hypothetical protein